MDPRDAEFDYVRRLQFITASKVYKGNLQSPFLIRYENCHYRICITTDEFVRFKYHTTAHKAKQFSTYSR